MRLTGKAWCKNRFTGRCFISFIIVNRTKVRDERCHGDQRLTPEGDDPIGRDRARFENIEHEERPSSRKAYSMLPALMARYQPCFERRTYNQGNPKHSLSLQGLPEGVRGVIGQQLLERDPKAFQAFYCTSKSMRDALQPVMPTRRRITNAAYLKRAIELCPQMTSLDLSSCEGLNDTILRTCGLDKLKNLTHLNLRYNHYITDAGLEPLTGLTQLQQLNLEYTQITDVGLEHLKHLTQLQGLNLGCNYEITDDGLEHLKDLTQLQQLNLERTQITDVGLEHLKKLTQLQQLNLERIPITDAGLAHLKELTKLQNLNLSSNRRITDVGLEHLVSLTKLQQLNLADTGITNAGLAHLARLTKLEQLNLDCTSITDAGLTQLKPLTELRTLMFANRWITGESLAHLITPSILTILRRLLKLVSLASNEVRT